MQPASEKKPRRRRRWLAIIVLPAIAALIVATAIANSGWDWSGAFRFSARARLDVATRVETATVTVIGDHVEVQPGPAFTKDELRALGDAVKARYPSTEVYPGVEGRVPLWKYSCEIEWVNGRMRLKRATALEGL